MIAIQTIRTFIAIDLSDEMRAGLDRVARALRGHLRGAGVADGVLRWSGVEKAHVTLRFLGETSTDQIEHVKGGLAAVLREQVPFALTLAGLGCFPSCARPTVVWVGITGDMAALGDLQSRVEQLAQSAGFPAETRPYSPHLTLARVGRQSFVPTAAPTWGRPHRLPRRSALGSLRSGHTPRARSHLHPKRTAAHRQRLYPIEPVRLQKIGHGSDGSNGSKNGSF